MKNFSIAVSKKNQQNTDKRKKIFQQVIDQEARKELRREYLGYYIWWCLLCFAIGFMIGLGQWT